MNKKINKKKKPFIPNPEGNFFDLGGLSSWATIQDSGQEVSNNGKIGSFKTGDYVGINKKPDPSKALGQGLAVAQGVMQLGSQIGDNFSTAGIGKEVQGVNDISRDDILNQQVNVNANKTNAFGQTASGAMTGATAGAAFGPLGMAIGGGIGAIAGGLSSVFGNDSKQAAKEQAERNWSQNLQAKDRQFQYQDLKSDMANFSALGGDLFAYGGNMPNKLQEFNAGGSHESNPNKGIQQGTGANGKPNLVEQGETKHEDYIFSDRLIVDKDIVSKYKLPSSLNGKTFADASKILNKEAKERPNDPISNNALKATLSKLTDAQEKFKEQQQIDKQDNEKLNQLGFGESVYAKGGQLNIKPEAKSEYNKLAKQQGIPTEQYVQDLLAGHSLKAFGGDLFNKFSNGGDQSHLTLDSGQGVTVYDEGGNLGAPNVNNTNKVLDKLGPNDEVDNQLSIYRYLTISLGLDHDVAKGVLSNVARESKFRATAEAPAGDYGLFQWAGDRRSELTKDSKSKNYRGVSKDSQLQFLNKELSRDDFAEMVDELKNIGSNKKLSSRDKSEKAALSFMKRYENPTANREGHPEIPQKNNIDLLDMYNSKWDSFKGKDISNEDLHIPSNQIKGGGLNGRDLFDVMKDNGWVDNTGVDFKNSKVSGIGGIYDGTVKVNDNPISKSGSIMKFPDYNKNAGNNPMENQSIGPDSVAKNSLDSPVLPSKDSKLLNPIGSGNPSGNDFDFLKSSNLANAREIYGSIPEIESMPTIKNGKSILGIDDLREVNVRNGAIPNMVGYKQPVGKNKMPPMQDSPSSKQEVFNPSDYNGLKQFGEFLPKNDPNIGNKQIMAAEVTSQKQQQAQKTAEAISKQKEAIKTGSIFDNFSTNQRYAPVFANMAMGINDMFQQPEETKYGRISPERINARMDYKPIDTEWMNNKMNSQFAGARDQMINQSGGNRATAMAGLMGLNQQGLNTIGEAYMKADELNYGRRQQANQFNAGIEAQNVAARNAAQAQNLQIQQQEMQANAMARAAKRNAARNAILQAATNIGQIGKENFDSKTGSQMFGYSQESDGTINYGGNKYKKQ